MSEIMLRTVSGSFSPIWPEWCCWCAVHFVLHGMAVESLQQETIRDLMLAGF